MPDFHKDLCEFAREQLNHYGISFGKNADLHTLLVKLNTFLEKYVRPVRRTVHISDQLRQKEPTFPDREREALKKMEEWVSRGEDINCFQSRGLHGKGSRDYQNMLYGIVHLHLSARKEDLFPVIEKDGFSKPGDFVLYALFRETDAYFIDAERHPDMTDVGKAKWTRKNLVEIIIQNWPEIYRKNLFYGAVACDAEGNEIDVDNNMIAELTWNHINPAINIGNALFFPENALTRRGDSATAVRNADRLIKSADLVQKAYEQDHNQLHEVFNKLLKASDREPPRAYNMHFEYDEDLGRFVVLDREACVTWDFENGKILMFSNAED